jgi:hypothetical protein
MAYCYPEELTTHLTTPCADTTERRTHFEGWTVVAVGGSPEIWEGLPEVRWRRGPAHA